MVWYITDDDRIPDIFRHGDRFYPVIDVAAHISTAINQQQTEEVEDENLDGTKRETIISSRGTYVSDLMIARFFTEIEGPDRDWSD